MDSFTPEQVTLLKEIADAGSNYATVALSQLLNKKVSLENASVEWKPFFSQFVLEDPEKRKTILHFRFMRGAKGNIFIVFTDEDAKRVTNYLAPGTDEKIRGSALREIGNILAGAYLNAVSRMTGKVFMPSTPGLFHNKWNSAIQSLLENVQLEPKKVWILRSEFAIDQKARFQFCFIADVEIMEILLNRSSA